MAKEVKLKELKSGEKVTIVYTKKGEKKEKEYADVEVVEIGKNIVVKKENGEYRNFIAKRIKKIVA